MIMQNELMEEIKLRLETNRYELKRLDEFYLKAFSPKAYKGCTSYNDYDTIPASNKEYRIEDFERKRNRLIKSIVYDENVLFELVNAINIDEYLELIKTNKEKVDYLRNVQGYTLKEIEEKLGLSRRHIQRILKRKV